MFAYKRITSDGKSSIGFINGDREFVIEQMLAQGYALVYLKEISLIKAPLLFFTKRDTIPVRDLIALTRQLKAMLDAGITLLSCFQIILEQAQTRVLKKVINSIQADLNSGLSLSFSLSRFPRIFSPVYVSMINSGEIGGMLAKNLEQLCSYLEKDQEIKNKIKTASLYPGIIAVVSLMVVILIITFVMPTFLGLYQSAGVDLPLPTKILIAVSDFIRNNFALLVFGAIIVAGGGIYLSSRLEKRLFIERCIYKLPWVGDIVKGLAVVRFSRTVGTLIQAGVPLLQSIKMMEGLTGASVLRQIMEEAGAMVSAGSSLASALKETGIFNAMVIQMIAAGEESGALEQMLVKLADYHEKEVLHLVDNLLAVLEPILIVIVAFFVGGIVISTLLPMFSMLDLVN
ncbi:MAG: type II secretion system F family protein [Syntrophomonadaceae bacterium]|jgi:type IV pilus assembly protein PilC|nr:type II secretion system F family protein [Syntrophomonadaceae bacterium]